MRTKFKLRRIEGNRDFSVNEILTKKGEPTGYNAEAIKYYDGSVNYWRIRNTRTNRWKRCETEKELFSTLEKIKSDSAYAEKFGEILSKSQTDKNQKSAAENKVPMDFKLKEICSGEDYTVNEILTEEEKKTGYNAKAIRYLDGKICYWRIENVKSKMWKRCLTWQDVCRTLEKIMTDSEYAKKFERPKKEAEDKALANVSTDTQEEEKKREDKIMKRCVAFCIFAPILVAILTARIWLPLFLKFIAVGGIISALASIPFAFVFFL